MGYFGKTKARMSRSLRTDPNWNRWASWIEPARKTMPSATFEYIIEKLPVAQWLPHYHLPWLVNDVIAGITLGVMFIPQGLAYARIATIPIEHGLYSSWIPSALYFFLGSSKELSTGPTSILGLLTAEVVHDLSQEGYAPEKIASAIAFMVGTYALAVGLLKLGFLLEFVSAPVLTGWISAVALVILLGQVGGLVGLSTRRETDQIIRDVLGHLDKIKPRTLAIGFSSIALLYILEWVGKTWGKKNRAIKLFSTSRAVLVLALFTLMSYLCNKDRAEEDYLWEVTEVSTNGIIPPRAHDSTLLTKVVSRSFAPFIAMAVEHLGVGKAFGLRNSYQIDKSQELVFLGVENIVNSLFGAMTTGAAMSRTAVNSECGVKSPVNFLFTAAWIVLTLYELSPALYWIPKATLSAIIIMAVVNLISPPRLFYRYWRMSFVDFVSSMAGFWITLFTSTEIGLTASVGFSIVYTLLRLAFPTIHVDATNEESNIFGATAKTRPINDPIEIPTDAFLVRFTEDLLFPNAGRVKSKIVDTVKLHYDAGTAASHAVRRADQNWNAVGNNKIGRIRRRRGIVPLKPVVAPLRHVVLDFTQCGFLDVTGLLSLIELKTELRRYIGEELQFRFVNMSARVRERFDRSEWVFAAEGEERCKFTTPSQKVLQSPQVDSIMLTTSPFFSPASEADVIYSSLENALLHREGDDRTETVQDEKSASA
ncbi:hypothetical protein NLU13_1408 [Sarocladium strictum]|uniref:STAS domain-containing protein n=1 Tax=Sarocladium strictum TaxID=5046 RepID=A0AA39LCC1_SARSR|nr:hypothetical protein NLU13_1408 [Sarocladium strictum]